MSLLSANLQAFVAIVRAGTVHSAAAELKLTQTGVTQRIRAIEKELGTTLFLRSRRGMTLTEDGEALLQYCSANAELEGEFYSRLGGDGERRATLSIIGPTSVMTARIAQQCLPLYAKWPQLDLHLVVSDLEDRLAAVKAGKATFAIVSPEQVPNEMTSKKLKSDRYLLVGSPQWRGRKLADIVSIERLIDFYESDSTSIRYLKKFDLINYLKRPRMFVNNNEVIARYFAEGIGFGTLTQEIAKPYLDRGDLIALNGGAMMEDPLALVWYPRPQMPEYFRDVVQTLK